MTFNVKDWKDYPPSEATPIDALALEDLERRLAAYTDQRTAAMPQPDAAEFPVSAYSTNRALSFIESMLEGIERPVGASTIKANADYPSTFSGPCSGTFALRDDPPPTVEGALLGTLHGVEFRETDRLISTDYVTKRATSESDQDTGAGRPAVPVLIDKFAAQTTVVTVHNLSPDRSVTLHRYDQAGTVLGADLTVAIGGTGSVTMTGATPEWCIVYFNGAPGATAYGEFEVKVDTSANLAGPGGGGTFKGYSVEAHIVVDTDYLWDSQPAKADGAFSFPYLNPGIRRFVLRRESDGAMLAEDRPPYTNVRSYVVAEGQPGYGTKFVEQSYAYDQAVALCAAIAAGSTKLAQRLAQGLLNFQTTGGTHDGGFVFSAVQSAPGYGDAAYRTGAHAIGVYALLSYLAAFPDDRSRDFAGAADRAISFLQAQLNSTYKLVTGGWGTYSDDGSGGQTFDPSVKLDWMSLEHNFDAYHALMLADVVRGGYAELAAEIGNAVETTLWDAGRGKFLQGIKGDGSHDTADPLDAHSWGAIFCMAYGDVARAQAIMTEAQLRPYSFTRETPEHVEAVGYSVNYDEPGYPGAVPTVWSEGTFGVAYAFARMDDVTNWRTTLDGITPSQSIDGSFYYVTDPDPSQDLYPYRSTIGAAWSILAALGHGIWGTVGNR